MKTDLESIRFVDGRAIPMRVPLLGYIIVVMNVSVRGGTGIVRASSRQRASMLVVMSGIDAGHLWAAYGRGMWQHTSKSAHAGVLFLAPALVEQLTKE